VAGLLIFGLTYALIASRRLAWLPLDRPGVVWLGAVAMVACGVLTPDAAFEAVDRRTLLLLLAVMGMGAFLEVDGFFEKAEAWLLARSGTPRRLLACVVWPSGVLAALITNDAVAVLAAPALARLAERRGLPPTPYLLALALSVNTGSAATLVGNPQNMLCAALGGLDYGAYLLATAPVAVGGLAIGHLWLLAQYRDALGGPAFPAAEAPVIGPSARRTLAVIVAVAVAATAGLDLAWTTAGGFAALMLVHRRKTAELWPRVDWPLLLFFAGLFVVVEGLAATGAPAAVFARFPLEQLGPVGFAAAVLVGSNLVSNVPLILVVADEIRGVDAWTQLALLSTLAGNLTLVGSVANLIVASASGGKLSFVEHLRVGVPVTLLCTAWALAWFAW
jgi:Na+/H+ antiporter NhaD/arsenite permease-like protein